MLRAGELKFGRGCLIDFLKMLKEKQKFKEIHDSYVTFIIPDNADIHIDTALENIQFVAF